MKALKQVMSGQVGSSARVWVRVEALTKATSSWLEMFYLKQLVGSASAFPYTLGTSYSTAYGEWTHFEGISREDNASVSVFRLIASKSDPQKLQAARNGVKRLKSVRVVPGLEAIFQIWAYCCIMGTTAVRISLILRFVHVSAAPSPQYLGIQVHYGGGRKGRHSGLLSHRECQASDYNPRQLEHVR